MKISTADREAVFEVIRQHPDGVTGAQIREILPHFDHHKIQGCTFRLRQEGRIIRKTSDSKYSPIWVVK